MAIIGIFFISFIITQINNNFYRDELKNHMYDIAQDKENLIIEFFKSSTNRLIDFSSDGKIKSCAESIGKNSLECNSEQFSNHLIINKLPVVKGLLKVFVLDINGKVIASSIKQNIELNKSMEQYFIQGIKEPSNLGLIYSKEFNKYIIIFSAPIYKQTKSTETLGVIVGEVALDELLPILNSSVNFCKTGELLLAFGSHDNITWLIKRRFEKQVSLNINEDSIPMKAALNGTEVIFDNIQDYRGISVISVSHPIKIVKSQNIGLVFKKDIAEVYQPIEIAQKLIIIVVFLVLLLSSLVMLGLSKLLSRHLVKLTSDIEQITKGDLNIILKKSNVDEIQSLIESLNRILASLKLAILRTGATKEDIGIGEAIKAKEKAEAKYKIIYETSSEAIMTLEPPEWKFTGGNNATIKIFGAKDEKDFISKAPWEFSPKKQPDGQLSSVKSKKMIEKAMKDGSNLFEWVYKRLNGEEFPATVLLNRIEEGGKIYLQAAVKDITNEKKIQDALVVSELRYRRLFETAQDAILILDADSGNIIDANPFIVELLGYSHKEFVGKKLWEVSPFKDISENKKKFMELLHKKYIRYENMPLETKSGKKAYVEFVSNMYNVDHIRIIQCNIRDITERKKLEELKKKLK